MAEKCHLPNAPISEALIDIRVTTNDELEVKKFSNLPSKLKKKFPTHEELKRFKSGFQVDQNKLEITSQAVDEGFIGCIYKSENNDRVVQLRKDGFTYSKLKPYIDWDDLKDGAKEFFEFYLSVAEPDAIGRIALRFINHINIPFNTDKFTFSDYLESPPIVPPNLPQSIPSFLNRVVLVEQDLGAIAVVNQALESVINTKEIPIILDIDVIIERDIDLESENIWEYFELLRNFKNDIFFSYITEKTKELFK